MRTAEPLSIVDLASELPGFRLAGGNTIVYYVSGFGQYLRHARQYCSLYLGGTALRYAIDHHYAASLHSAAHPTGHALLTIRCKFFSTWCPGPPVGVLKIVIAHTLRAHCNRTFPRGQGHRARILFLNQYVNTCSRLY